MSLPTPYYEREGITIFCGKAEDVLPHLEPSACITDPPYGIEFRGQEWDKQIPEVAFRLPGIFTKCVIITAPLAMWNYPTPNWVACWARPASSSRSLAGGFNHWSPILLYGPCTMRVDFKSLHAIQHAYKPGFGHPSPKPLALMRWLVGEVADAGETVVDPFCGSGTTLLAAKQEGCRAIGIDVSEEYCALAVARLAQKVIAW